MGYRTRGDNNKGKTSAGILLYRRTGNGDSDIEVLVAHPGGPFYGPSKDNGHWSIPKGGLNDGERLAEAAVREFREETGYTGDCSVMKPLGAVMIKSGKTIHAWAVEGDMDADVFRSNMFELEYPPKSGIIRLFPEIDRLAWCSPDVAKLKLNPFQGEFVDRLLGAPIRPFCARKWFGRGIGA